MPSVGAEQTDYEKSPHSPTLGVVDKPSVDQDRGRAVTKYDVLRNAIKQGINKQDMSCVKIDEEFLKQAKYNIVSKGRYKYTVGGRWLISEEDSRYENMSTETATTSTKVNMISAALSVLKRQKAIRLGFRVG